MHSGIIASDRYKAYDGNQSDRQESYDCCMACCPPSTSMINFFFKQNYVFFFQVRNVHACFFCGIARKRSANCKQAILYKL